MIKPMGDWVVCKMPKTQEKIERSGLHIPESAQWAPVEALVLAKGPKVMLDVKPGDRVVHEMLAGLEVEDKDWGKILMLQQKDIQGVLTA
jgi:co-chaperonin GroES (HSP10)